MQSYMLQMLLNFCFKVTKIRASSKKKVIWNKQCLEIATV